MAFNLKQIGGNVERALTADEKAIIDWSARMRAGEESFIPPKVQPQFAKESPEFGMAPTSKEGVMVGEPYNPDAPRAMEPYVHSPEVMPNESGIVPYKKPSLDEPINVKPIGQSNLVPSGSMSQEQIQEAINSGDPSRLQTMLDYINGNKGKIGAAVGGAGAIGYGMSQMGDQPQLPPQVPVVKPQDNKKIETQEAVVAPEAVKSAVSKASSKPKEESEKSQSVSQKVDEVKQPGNSIDFGTGSIASQENLQAVQDKANQTRMMAGIMPGIEKINSGLSAIGSGGKYIPTTDSKEFYMNLGKQADQGMVDYKSKIEMEKLDPNSGYSKGLKDMAKKLYNVDIQGNVSAKDLQDGPLKLLEKQYEQQMLDSRQRDLKEMQVNMMRENSKDRTATLAVTREGINQRHEEVMDERKSKHFDQWKKNVLNSNPSLSQARNAVIGANKMFASFGFDPNVEYTPEMVDKMDSTSLKRLSEANPTLVNEAAIELNNILSRAGTPAQTTLQKLVPSNIKMDAAKWGEWLTSQPQGAGQQQFLKQYLKIAANAAQGSKSYIKDQMKHAASGSSKIRAIAPEDYDMFLAESGLTPEDVIPSSQLNKQIPNTIPKAKMIEKPQVSTQNVTPKVQTLPSNKPKRVTQNGHTYILNEQTGKYEPEQLQ